MSLFVHIWFGGMKGENRPSRLLCLRNGSINLACKNQMALSLLVYKGQRLGRNPPKWSTQLLKSSFEFAWFLLKYLGTWGASVLNKQISLADGQNTSLTPVNSLYYKHCLPSLSLTNEASMTRSAKKDCQHSRKVFQSYRFNISLHVCGRWFH